ncbi:MAG TPA: universal stress protein [Euzebyales bacterium]|nr:universal stress protein [Euzebyales bacterium]
MKIVVAIDGSPHATRALAWAVEEAELRSAALTVLHAFGVGRLAGALDGGTAAERREAEAIELVRHALDPWTTSGVDADIAVAPALGRQVAGALLHHARDADLLVLGSRGLGGFPGLLLGSVSQQVVTHASVPVAVIPYVDGAAIPPVTTSVVVGIDGSPSSRRALEWGAEEARLRDVPVEAVLVRPAVDPVTSDASASELASLDEQADEGARRRLLTIIRDTLGVRGTDVLPRVLAGQAAHVLVTVAARSSSLVVVGSRGREGFAGLLLGSVSMQCLTHARGPVVVIHGS